MTKKLKPGVVTEIPIDELVPDPTQPRTAFPPKPLQDLADNIKVRGIRQPITVIWTAGGIVIKTGERRWQAAKLAGLKTVPCLQDPDADDQPQPADATRLLDQIAENDLREGLNPMERAESLARMQDAGLGPQEISDLMAKHGIHMARSTVSNLLRLMKLPDGIQELVRGGTLRESYARDLLRYVEHPKILAAIGDKLRKETGEIWKDLFNKIQCDVLDGHAENLYFSECKDCSCLLKLKDEWGDDAEYCLDKAAIEKKRFDARKPVKAAAAPVAKKKVESDPTKAKPVKVKLSDDGVVATARRSWDSYNYLDSAGFDKTPCEGCPHRHSASHNGAKDRARDACFLPPCFQNLKRHHTKLENRAETIRGMIDEQLIPVLVGVASQQPMANALLTPLLAFHAASNEGNYYGRLSLGDGLQLIGGQVKRRQLKDFLSPALTDADASKIVAQVVRSLPKERRHELAVYLSMNVTDWWHNTEEFAKLFVKAELKVMAPHYDPPDVPVDAWRERLLLEDTPAIVIDIWKEDWIKGGTPQLDDDDEDGADRCRVCGCTEFDPCDGGCQWAELPDMDGLGLCSACVDKKAA